MCLAMGTIPAPRRIPKPCSRWMPAIPTSRPRRSSDGQSTAADC